jgi:hypothetical protein
MENGKWEIIEEGVIHEIKNRLGFIIDNFKYTFFYGFAAGQMRWLRKPPSRHLAHGCPW